MESLSEDNWDVVISGTSLTQSLLALALSKCDLKVLHVDRNDYYGGIDAALSLDEVQRWVQRNTARKPEVVVSEQTKDLLGPSRSYTISLNPQIIYAKSRFLPSLVSSQIHTQLEFQAVGSFYVLHEGNLTKIPSNREDVFADDSLSVRDKRKLMNLLRYVVDEHDEDTEDNTSMRDVLQDRFKLSQNLDGPVQALSLTTSTLNDANFATAATRLKRHFMSMGYFGPGLAAVMAKYGGNSELAQVACRAGAVGGFVYLLGQGVASVDTDDAEHDHLSVTLTSDITVKTKHLVGTLSDLPESQSQGTSTATPMVSHRVSIISDPLKHLFIAPAENGAIPAVVIVLMNTDDDETPPVYLQLHSEDTGECPAGKCIIYASTADQTFQSQARLEIAISTLLRTASMNSSAEVLWTLTYSASSSTSALQLSDDEKIIVLPERSHDLALDDSVLDDVKAAWTKILGERSAEYDFLQFEERREPNDDEE